MNGHAGLCAIALRKVRLLYNSLAPYRCSKPDIATN